MPVSHRAGSAAGGEEQHAFLRKVSPHLSLSAGACAVLERLLSANVRRLASRATLIDSGAPPHEVSVLLSGWAARVAALPNGRRQITALFVPGDVCNLDAFLLGRADQDIVALSALRVAHFGQSTLDLLSERSPEASRAFLWDMAGSAAVQRSWTVNVAQRSARRRIGFLLTSMWRRLDAVGLASDDGMPFPLTQNDIADACGLTSVHTNRTLQDMRGEGLLELKDRRLTFLNRAGVAVLVDDIR